MAGLKGSIDFDVEMVRVKAILDVKGYVVESDHPYAYSMQYRDAFEDVRDWLEIHGYEGELQNQGHFEEGVGAVYGLYDTNKLSYEEMLKELKREAKKQASIG